MTLKLTLLFCSPKEVAACCDEGSFDEGTACTLELEEDDTFAEEDGALEEEGQEVILKDVKKVMEKLVRELGENRTK